MATLRALPGTMIGASSDAFPAASQLAALGPVLCLYRTQQGSELAGWQQAVRVIAHAGVDSDGLDERLLFFDAQGRCCWRLCLLPDSDFVAWDRLVASLPKGQDGEVAGLADRLWQRLAGRLLGGQWRACALQLNSEPRPASLPLLAASLSLMSPLGVATAQRIAQAEGAEMESGLHDCCCEPSARFTTGNLTPDHEAGDKIVPSTRLT